MAHNSASPKSRRKPKHPATKPAKRKRAINAKSEAPTNGTAKAGHASRRKPSAQPPAAPPPAARASLLNRTQTLIHANGNQIDLLQGFNHEDVGNAQRIVRMYGDRLRFCHAMNKWLIWDERRWRPDETQEALFLAQTMMEEFGVQAIRAHAVELAKFAVRSLQRSRILHALELAQPRLAIQPNQLDTDPDLLNFQNGTLNLKTGELFPHAREQYITKLVHHDYLPQTECPIFLSFLARIMGIPKNASDADEAAAAGMNMMRHLQVVFGYCLTGHTYEKAIFLLYGKTADNGKTTLLTTFLKLLEEYSTKIQIDSLMSRPQESNNVQADLADLRGARFVMTSETEEGQRLSEGKLKNITQGSGLIKATRKYENPILFRESHKLCIDTNSLPVIRGTDNGIWNRLHVIPFNVTIPKNEQDKTLDVKLLSEAEGILALAVEGARIWYREGLQRPAEVQAAADIWRHDSDQIRRFIDECCIEDKDASERARSLYVAYQNWASGNGEKWVVCEKEFSNRLAELNFSKDRNNVCVCWLGIRMRTLADGREDNEVERVDSAPFCSLCRGHHTGVCRAN